MSFGAAELRELAQLLRAVARLEIMPRWRALEEGDVRSKGSPNDLVTVADEAAEARIGEGLRALFPGCAVVGEEAVAADRSVLDRLREPGLAFVVDPIDGTHNFWAGLPLFGVMAAAVVDGQVVGSVIHDPVGDDCAMALAGQGAWTDAADGSRRVLRVARAAPVAEMNGCVSWRYMKEPLRGTVLLNLVKLGHCADFRCAAHQYRMTAAGAAHFQVFHRLLPWDHAPGWLLHQEAGGYSARLDGTPYDVTDTTGGLICAPDRESWVALRDALVG